MTTATNVLPFPRGVTLIPLREYHVDRGEGRTVAVLFAMAVDHVHHPAGDADQNDADHQTLAGIGGDS